MSVSGTNNLKTNATFCLALLKEFLMLLGWRRSSEFWWCRAWLTDATRARSDSSWAFHLTVIIHSAMSIDCMRC